MTPYEQGFTAFRNKKPIDANPFGLGSESVHWEAWRNGWFEARETGSERIVSEDPNDPNE